MTDARLRKPAATIAWLLAALGMLFLAWLVMR